MLKPLKKKFEILEKIIRELKKSAVAFSGGVDSSFLLKYSIDVLGRENVVAVIEKGELYPEEETQSAIKLAEEFQVKYFIIEADQMKDTYFTQNPVDRCFHCKKDLFGNIKKIVPPDFCIVDGSNADDVKDFRPGEKSKKLFNVRSPLQEAELTKDDIRKISKEMGLPTWNKPSFACFSSRIPYGKKITREKLSRIEKAERYLKNKGFWQVRVRDYGKTCRIEVLPDEFAKILKERDEIVKELKKTGYLYITLDLAGYRTGSMNEILENL
ncbi:MAG: ATP-dependent sacrificial sulfur transferase LarE [Candidatus Omnitrophica bacterium]|nr:ATP-dependent sacrificial sulfur transferase LarE [Candidatus Omnitrophota bacterium]